MTDLTSWIHVWKAGLPIWVIALGALVAFLMDAAGGVKAKKALFAFGASVLLLALFLAFKQWSSPVIHPQNVFLSDNLTSFFLTVTFFVALLSLFNSYSYFEFLPGALVTLILLSVLGMAFLFASENLLVTFIGLEIMSLSIYILVGLNRHDSKSSEAAIKYYVMGSVASAILLFGVALLYGAYGSLEISQIGSTQALLDGPLAKIGFAFFLTGVLFKVSAAPFHFWTPDAYEGAPTPVTGFMATGVKIAVFAFLMRVLAAFHWIPLPTIKKILILAIVLTLLVGNLGAILQENVKRMLAYSSIAHAGYLLLGLAVGFGEKGFDGHVTSAVIFYLLSYSITTLGAFAVLSVLLQGQKEATGFQDLAGLGRSKPVLALIFSLFMLSLLGLPPTVGFVAKYGIFSFAIKNGYVGLAVFGIMTSLVSAYYYLRPVVVMYFGEKETPMTIPEISFPAMLTLVFCSLGVLYLGLHPSSYLKLASLAAGVFP